MKKYLIIIILFSGHANAAITQCLSTGISPAVLAQLNTSSTELSVELTTTAKDQGIPIESEKYWNFNEPAVNGYTPFHWGSGFLDSDQSPTLKWSNIQIKKTAAHLIIQGEIWNNGSIIGYKRMDFSCTNSS